MNKISDNIVYHQEKDDGGKSSTSWTLCYLSNQNSGSNENHHFANQPLYILLNLLTWWN
jgi:hypothetical protein